MMCLFGVSLILHPIYICLYILPFMVNKDEYIYGIRSPWTAPNSETFVLSKLLHWSQPNFAVIERPNNSLWTAQMCPKQIQDGVRPSCWDIEISQYLYKRLTDFDLIRHGDASRFFSPRQPIKLSDFLNSKMAVLKIEKNTISQKQTATSRNAKVWENPLHSKISCKCYKVPEDVYRPTCLCDYRWI